MSSHLMALLGEWHPLRDDHDWVLGTLYKTEGPAYRKAGAMMLLSSSGHQLGMLSGGCLEADIHLHARQVMHHRKAKTVTYDGSDEDDISFQLGIGCGGTVYILLQPVAGNNQYLMLDRLYQTLCKHHSAHYHQLIPDATGEVAVRFLEEDGQVCANRKATLLQEGNQQWLHTLVSPPPHLLIAGGGMDARPVATIAHQLGWRISVWDPRPANARAQYFPVADRLLRGPADELTEYVHTQGVMAAIVMSHNLRLDAQALRALRSCRLGYLALLGPANRRDRVLEEAGITMGQLTTSLAGPAGFDIGAELPESIALSILSECHAALQNRPGGSLSRPSLKSE